MKKNSKTSRPEDTESDACWAIEIERSDGMPSEFFSVESFRAGREDIQIITPGGTQVSFKTVNVRKVLLMRVKDRQQ